MAVEGPNKGVDCHSTGGKADSKGEKVYPDVLHLQAVALSLLAKLAMSMALTRTCNAKQAIKCWQIVPGSTGQGNAQFSDMTCHIYRRILLFQMIDSCKVWSDDKQFFSSLIPCRTLKDIKCTVNSEKVSPCSMLCLEG